MPYETKQLALLFERLKDWDAVKSKVLEEDILQRNSLATRKRLFVELKRRIEQFNEDELRYFNDAPIEDVKILVFVGCLKSYRFIFEFIIEVIRQKYLLFDYQIETSDYNSFYESKAAASNKLNLLSETTQKKLRQVMFHMLAEVGLIESTKNYYITKPLVSEPIIHLLLDDDIMLLKALLLNDDEIDYYARRIK